MRISKSAAFKFSAVPLALGCFMQIWFSIVKTNQIRSFSDFFAVVFSSFIVFYSPFVIAIFLLYKSKNPLLSLGVTIPCIIVYSWTWIIDVNPKTPTIAGSGDGLTFTVSWVFALIASSLVLFVWFFFVKYIFKLEENVKK
jgi:hypothetical protein